MIDDGIGVGEVDHDVHPARAHERGGRNRAGGEAGDPERGREFRRRARVAEKKRASDAARGRDFTSDDATVPAGVKQARRTRLAAFLFLVVFGPTACREREKESARGAGREARPVEVSDVADALRARRPARS